MDYSNRLALSYYEEVAVLNEEHKVYMVQHRETKRCFVKKVLDVYNLNIYKKLKANPVEGTPEILELYEEETTLTVIEEYISGETLQEKMNSSTLSKETILMIMDELCQIVIKLHKFNPPIIHRDIKPTNIIITPYNKVFLLDFNAAKFLAPLATEDTMLLGTKGYAAPEQYGFGSSTEQTDVYALGILLNEMAAHLIGIHPFLKTIVDTCTKMSPSDRYDSVKKLREELTSLAQKNSVIPVKKQSYNRYALPGFRSHSFWRAPLAIGGYLFLLWVSLSLEMKDTFGTDLWVAKISSCLIFLAIIFVSTNYLNMQKMMPLCQYKNRIVRYIGIILLDMILISIVLIIMLMVMMIV